MFTIWHGLFPLVLMFSGLRIEALPTSTVLGKSIYTFFLSGEPVDSISHVCNKPSKNRNVFLFQMLVVPGPIYRPPMQHYQFGRFIGQACQNSRIEWADLSTKHAYQTRFFGRFIDQSQPKV